MYVVSIWLGFLGNFIFSEVFDTKDYVSLYSSRDMHQSVYDIEINGKLDV